MESLKDPLIFQSRQSLPFCSHTHTSCKDLRLCICLWSWIRGWNCSESFCAHIHTYSLCITTVFSPECIKPPKCINMLTVKRNIPQQNQQITSFKPVSSHSRFVLFIILLLMPGRQLVDCIKRWL